MCKKVLNEDLEHIFVKCDMVKKWFHYVKENFLENKETSNSLVLLKFKRRMMDEDYRTLSCFVYVVWRVRNECKHRVTQVLPAQPIQTFHVPIDPQTIVIQRSSSEASVASTESLVPCEICNKKFTKRGMTKHKNSKHATAQ
jgi:hypothetical protein